MHPLLSFCVVFVSLFLTGSTFEQEKHFDFLIFTQLWPASDCLKWKEEKPKNTCIFHTHQWTIHGIWPTIAGQKGPFHCNNQKFDPAKIMGIIDDLRDRWANVHANSPEDSFWEHEWDKHGTCAMQIPELNDEYKFFSQALKWNLQFPIAKYLADANITMGGNYDFDEIYEAIKKKINGKNPSVACDYSHHVKSHIISQVEICFFKNMTLRDCDDVYGGTNQRCPTQGKEIFYPDADSVPIVQDVHIIIAEYFGAVVGIGALCGLLYFGFRKLYNTRRSTSGYESI